jgi:cytochrome c oxidase subunit 2
MYVLRTRGDPLGSARMRSDSVNLIRDCPRERGSFVGLQLPSRAAAPIKKGVRAAVLGLGLLALGACSAEDKEQIGRLAMPSPASEQAPATFELWKWSWVAAAVVGVIVWALMFYAAFKYRRTAKNQVPVQTRYNLPLEIFYTIAPIMMVIVFFYWTVDAQNRMLDDDIKTDHVVDVVGQQWSWTFNYTEQGADGKTPRVVGTTAERPTLVLPVDQTVEFKLHSPDVIHSFGIDSFLMKMDIIPGTTNSFKVTPNVIGTFNGKCFELCGVYHSRMIFDVEVVSQADYAAYLADLEATGQVSEKPLLGGADVKTVAGLDSNEEGGHE